MAIGITGPGTITFSRNQVLFTLKSDAYYKSEGKPTVVNLVFDFYAPQEYTFTLTYGNIPLKFTIANKPEDDGYQIVSRTVSTAEEYAHILANGLASNFYLNRDFEFGVGTDGNNNYFVVITARKHGALYNLTIEGTTNMSLRYVQQGTDDVLNKNFKLFYQLYVENQAQTEFSMVSEAYLPTQEDGIATINLSDSLTNALLADGNDRPNLKSSVAGLDSRFLRRYYIRYAEAYGDDQVIKKIHETGKYYALLGGISKERLEDFAFPDSFQSGDKLVFLKQDPKEKYIRPEQPEFLTMVTFTRDFNTLTFKTKLYFTDDTNQLISSFTFFNTDQYKRLTFPVGFVQNNLHLVSSTKQVLKYEVYLVDENDTIVTETKTYWLDYDYKPYTKFFLYLSSFGTYDTHVTYGKGSTAYDLMKSSADISRVGNFQLMDGEQIDFLTALANTETVTTGYRSKREIRQFKDLFLSRDKFIVRKGRAYPVTLATKEIAEFKDGDNLFALSFEIGFGFKESLWTYDEKDDLPAGLFFPMIIGGGIVGGNNLPADYYDYRYYLKTETYNKDQVNQLLADLQSTVAQNKKIEADHYNAIMLALNQKANLIHDHGDIYVSRSDINDLIIQINDFIKGGGGASLARDVRADLTVGAVAAGTVLTTGMNFTEFVEALMTKVFFPNIIPPSFGLAHAEGPSIEVGTSLTVDLVFSFNRGLIQATWSGGSDLPYTGLASAYRFYNADGVTFTSVSSPNFQFTNYQVKAGNNNVFKADVIIAAGAQPKDSKGNNVGSPYPGGTSPIQQTNFHGYYASWFGPVDNVPGAGAAPRSLDGKQPNSAGNSFILNSGSSKTKLVIITAPGLSLASVVDLDALNSVITSEYELQGTMAVNDAGGKPVSGFSIYLKTMGVAYTSNHRHQITLA